MVLEIAIDVNFLRVSPKKQKNKIRFLWNFIVVSLKRNIECSVTRFCQAISIFFPRYFDYHLILCTEFPENSAALAPLEGRCADFGTDVPERLSLSAFPQDSDLGR